MCNANPDCVCDREAGCTDIGCKCIHKGDIYQPYTHPEQAELPAGCPACPKVYCPSQLARVDCNGIHECDSEELKALIKA